MIDSFFFSKSLSSHFDPKYNWKLKFNIEYVSISSEFYIIFNKWFLRAFISFKYHFTELISTGRASRSRRSIIMEDCVGNTALLGSK